MAGERDERPSLGGVTILAGISLLLALLKLGHVVALSWGWVFAPLWVLFATGAVVVLVLFTMAALFERRPRRRR